MCRREAGPLSRLEGWSSGGPVAVGELEVESRRAARSRPSSPSAMLEGPTFAPTTVPPVVSMAVVTFAAASAACRRSASRLPSSPCSWSCSLCFPALPVAGPATYLAVCLRVLAGRVSFPSSRLFSPPWSPSRAPLAVCSPLCSSEKEIQFAAAPLRCVCG